MKKIFIIILLFNLPAYSQWFPLNSGTSSHLYSVCFVDAQTGYSCGVSAIIKTTNGGANWTSINNLNYANLTSIQFINTLTGICTVRGGTNGGAILRTTNGGANWSVFDLNSNSQLTSVNFLNPSTAICTGSAGTILYSTNGGINWLTGLPIGNSVTFYAADMINSTTGYCGGVNTIFAPLFAKTTDGGANWAYSSFYVNGNEATIHGLFFRDEQNGIAVSVFSSLQQGGISRTTNGGLQWTHQVVNAALFGVDFPSVNIGYVCGIGVIYKTIDAGGTWTMQSTNTTELLRNISFTDNFTGYAVGSNGIILKTTSGGVTFINPISNEIPQSFSLSQNYPNPFNPSTKIRFAISGTSVAQSFLSVYDVLGREVATLVNESLKPGSYEVEWNASNFPSGVYYYKLVVSDNTKNGLTDTKKMVLIK